VKFTPSTMYDGRANLNTFDKWTYEVRNWVRLCKYTDKMALPVLAPHLSGDASRFFINYVVNHEEKWMLRGTFEAMLDYWFPRDFKDQLRARLSQSV
jgi:hypothetical protein